MGNLLPNVGKVGGDGASAARAELAFVEGVSASMRPVEAVIRELAQSDVPVLLLAEPGAGKHATAQRIHQMSQRSGQPFVWFQCLGLRPEELDPLQEQVSEGVGVEAGTIYLEELSDLSVDCQGRLLEALPLSPGNGGANRARARLICGSARDLEVEVKRGRLREDLYYRISGV
jgi:DNA-binding NtrC family response regulator